MTTVVCFDRGDSTYCLPIEATRAVRTAEDMIRLPAARPDVAGIIPGDPPLTVISPLGPGGGQILVVEAGGQRFGLLVDAVGGLLRIDDGKLRPAPRGQNRGLISGTVDADGRLLLVTDPDALAGRL